MNWWDWNEHLIYLSSHFLMAPTDTKSDSNIITRRLHAVIRGSLQQFSATGPSGRRAAAQAWGVESARRSWAGAGGKAGHPARRSIGSPHAPLLLHSRGSGLLTCATPRAGCGRSEEGRYGRTVEAIEQPIASPASSPVGAPTRMWFVRDVRSRTYGNPSFSCSPGLCTRARGALRVQKASV